MSQILRDMSEQERRGYDNFCKDHPWLAEVKMTDDELRALLDEDLGSGYINSYWKYLYNDFWSWVCIGVWKHFYEHNEFAETGSNYVDGQNEAVINDILLARGIDWKDIKTLEVKNRTE